MIEGKLPQTESALLLATNYPKKMDSAHFSKW
jgi:hypothetical protein